MSAPTRHGNPWSEDEIQKLLQAVKRKETHVQIAVAHQRTQGGISSKLRGLAADYYFNDNRPIEDIMRFTGLDSETITDAISKRQYQMDMKEKKVESQVLAKPSILPKVSDPQQKREYMTSLLVEIRDMMKEMLTLMKENSLAGEHELNTLAHPQDDESVEEEDVE
jgi:hypothetical protein